MARNGTITSVPLSIVEWAIVDGKKYKPFHLKLLIQGGVNEDDLIVPFGADNNSVTNPLSRGVLIAKAGEDLRMSATYFAFSIAIGGATGIASSTIVRRSQSNEALRTSQVVLGVGGGLSLVFYLSAINKLGTAGKSLIAASRVEFEK